MSKLDYDVLIAGRVSDFILAVPKSSVTDAKQIMRKLEVTCTLWSYQIQTDDNGHAKSAEFSSPSTTKAH